MQASKHYITPILSRKVIIIMNYTSRRKEIKFIRTESFLVRYRHGQVHDGNIKKLIQLDLQTQINKENGCDRRERNTGLPALLKFETLGWQEGRVTIDKPAYQTQYT